MVKGHHPIRFGFKDANRIFMSHCCSRLECGIGVTEAFLTQVSCSPFQLPLDGVCLGVGVLNGNVVLCSGLVLLPHEREGVCQPEQRFAEIWVQFECSVIMVHGLVEAKVVQRTRKIRCYM